MLARLGAIFGRYTAIFVISAFLNIALQTANLLVLTQFLSPKEYGRLGLELVFASVLTVFCNLSILQGTLLVVFGSSGDEDAGDAFDTDAVTADKRAGLATGVTLTVLLVLVLDLALAPIRGTLAQLITHHSRYANEALLAIVSGGLGSVQRITVNVLRLERRPVQYVAVNLLRPAATLAISTPLVASGQGVQGGLIGVIIGTLLSIGAALSLTFRAYAPQFRVHLAGQILRRGSPYIPINISFWFLHSADAFVLSRFRSTADVGRYRLASRIGNISSYYVSGFLMSWSPITRMSAFHAANLHEPRRMRGLLLTYFVLSNLLLVLGLALFGPVLLQLTPRSYSGASRLVAPIAVAYALYGLFIAIYRLSEVRGARAFYIVYAASAALTFVAASILITPGLGGLGTAVSLNIAYAVPGVIMVSVLQRQNPQPLQYGRWAAGTLLAGTLYAGARLAQPAGILPQIASDLVAVVAFPILLLELRVVPRRHVRLLAGMLREMLPSRKAAQAAQFKLRELDEIDHQLVLLALQRHGSTEHAAAVTGLSRPEVELRVVWALRRVGDLGGPVVADARIGAFLLSRMPMAERDVMARELWRSGLDPSELDELERVRDTVRRGLPPDGRLRRSRTPEHTRNL